MPKIHTPGSPVINAQLLKHRYLTNDGSILPLREWLPQQEPIKAVMVAVHGFNDYSHFFQEPGEFFSLHGVACYAYDQRGFGGSPQHGTWAGSAAYADDLTVFIRLIHNKYPQVPVYVLGESMGAAVIITTMSQTVKPKVQGIVLSAPAIWGRTSMPWYQQALLWSLAHTLPTLTLTGRGLKIRASDNIPMLKALSRDPLVIKATRIEAVYGLSNLMDNAQHDAHQVNQTSLLLYGDHDQLIPSKPVYRFIDEFLQSNTEIKTIALYQKGYHMLLRDLDAPTIWQDILSWINSPSTPLPSQADGYAKIKLNSVSPN